MKKRTILTVVIFCLLTVPLFSQEKRTMNFVDVIDLKRVSGPKLSPDGRSLLFTISSACWKENKTISHIWRVDTNGKDLVQMTNGKEGEGAVPGPLMAAPLPLLRNAMRKHRSTC